MADARVLIRIYFQRHQTGEWHATSDHKLLEGIGQHGRSFEECKASAQTAWPLLLNSQGETREIDWREEILQ